VEQPGVAVPLWLRDPVTTPAPQARPLLNQEGSRTGLPPRMRRAGACSARVGWKPLPQNLRGACEFSRFFDFGVFTQLGCEGGTQLLGFLLCELLTQRILNGIKLGKAGRGVSV
jgi:hypothetical protein